MSSFLTDSPAYNDVTGVAIAGTGLYQLGKNIQRGMEGSLDKVHFVQNNVTRVEFDASLQETHGVEAKPTEFPVESGAVISDHIMVAPIQLQIAAIVTDTPTNNRQALMQNVFVSGVVGATGALGVVTYNNAMRYLNSTKLTQSPSSTTFDELLRMCVGDPDSSPPTFPQPFDVVTKLRRYPSMVMRSLSVPQDNTTGSALVFNMTLAQIRVVSPLTRKVKVFKAPVVASPKEEKGEMSAIKDKVVSALKSGVNLGDTATGHELTYKDL